jgi:hypothetical protein
MVCGKVAKNRGCHVPLLAWISKRSEAIESSNNDVFFDIESKGPHSIERKKFRSEANMFILKNLNIEPKINLNKLF